MALEQTNWRSWLDVIYDALHEKYGDCGCHGIGVTREPFPDDVNVALRWIDATLRRLDFTTELTSERDILSEVKANKQVINQMMQADSERRKAEFLARRGM